MINETLFPSYEFWTVITIMENFWAKKKKGENYSQQILFICIHDTLMNYFIQDIFSSYFVWEFNFPLDIKIYWNFCGKQVSYLSTMESNFDNLLLNSVFQELIFERISLDSRGSTVYYN